MCNLGRLALFCFAFSACFGQNTAKRPLHVDDVDRFQNVHDPQCSPDGQWVAYTVSTVDREADKSYSNLWMVSWDGAHDYRLTYDKESETSPRWSPDGRYLSFVSSRPGDTKGSQLWLLDRRGGEARQLTHIKDHTLSQYDWSPDSKRLLLIMQEKDEPDADEKPTAGAPPKPPKPIVIDRYHFKEDGEGYLTGSKHNHIYIFDIESGKLTPLTTGRFDETEAAWSPDGTKIAFVSNRDKDPDRTGNTDVFVIDAQAGASPRKLTNYSGPDSGKLAWSPDSKSIAYLQGSEDKFTAYNMDRLALARMDGAPTRVLTSKLDRGVSSPEFASDGRSIFAVVADDRSEYPARVAVDTGTIHRLDAGPRVVSALSYSPSGHTAVLASTDDHPPEIFALDNGTLRKLTSHNDALLSDIALATVEDISFKSHDGTEVHGFITKPAPFDSAKKYPTLLRIHGGPNGQDGHAFSFEHQLFAANGYVVISVNYRGSAGRGEKYGESIFADWGNKEVADLLAGVDRVLAMGIADPDRLGIGGWSYGGILTDYTIASDPRFKAAISGAGSAGQTSMYGVDEYTRQYDIELGPPWQNTQAWIKISYPFFQAQRIHTPTLFMGGDKDFNVPLIGSEQMYQALRTLGIPTELVIYPGEFHGFKRPSFIRDRYQRYLAWYDKYLKGTVSAEAPAPHPSTN